MTIGLMVLGFVVWWPLGLAMIGYILWGDRFQEQIDSAERRFKNAARDSRWGAWGSRPGPFSASSRQPTSNAAFNEYRSKEIERLQQERRRLDDEVNEFEDFLANLRHARDRQEFDRFMNERHEKHNEKPDPENPKIIET